MHCKEDGTLARLPKNQSTKKHQRRDPLDAFADELKAQDLVNSMARTRHDHKDPRLPSGFGKPYPALPKSTGSFVVSLSSREPSLRRSFGDTMKPWPGLPQSARQYSGGISSNVSPRSSFSYRSSSSESHSTAPSSGVKEHSTLSSVYGPHIDGDKFRETSHVNDEDELAPVKIQVPLLVLTSDEQGDDSHTEQIYSITGKEITPEAFGWD